MELDLPVLLVGVDHTFLFDPTVFDASIIALVSLWFLYLFKFLGLQHTLLNGRCHPFISCGY